MRLLILLATIIMLTSCHMFDDGNEDARQAALRWAEAYFNYDLKGTLAQVTPESEKWVRFVASNVNEQDVELLNSLEEATTVEVEDYYAGGDTLGTAYVRVKGYLVPDSIGKGGRMEDDGLYIVQLVKRNGQWKVRMEGLPQSEKQSRD